MPWSDCILSRPLAERNDHLKRWFFTVWLCVALPHLAAATPTEVDWERVLGGEVMVLAARSNEGLPGLRAMFAVSASRERIWSVLVDYENFRHIFPGIKKLRVLEHNVQGAKVAFWIPVAFLKLHYVLHRRYVAPGRRLTWTRIAGAMKRIEGSWEIHDTPRPGVHLLVYESYVQVGRLIPTRLVRRGAMRRAGAMGERLRAWIEALPATGQAHPAPTAQHP